MEGSALDYNCFHTSQSLTITHKKYILFLSFWSRKVHLQYKILIMYEGWIKYFVTVKTAHHIPLKHTIMRYLHE